MINNFSLSHSGIVVLMIVGFILTNIIMASPFFMHDSLVEWMTSWQVQMFSMFCHQDLERTFHINGIPAAVCGRCFGIYGGLLAGFAGWPIIRKKSTISESAFLTFLAGTSFIIVLDGFAQWAGFWTGSNIQRFFTGILWGVSITLYILKILNTKME